jgi:uncharacterized protein (TIGR02246 family)
LNRFFAVALWLFIGTLLAGYSQTTESQESALRGLDASIALAWNQGDTRAIASLWSQNGSVVLEDGRRVQGPGEIQNLLAQRFLQTMQVMRLVSETQLVRFMNPDAAIVSGKRTFLRRSDSSNGSFSTAPYIALWQKEDGKWKIVTDQWFALQPPDLAAIATSTTKDQSTVEVAIAANAASRLAEWMKLLGYYVGLPVALVLALLGGVGIKKYTSFNDLLVEVQKKLADEQSRVASKAEEFEKQLQEKSKQLDEAARLSAQFNDLNSKVQRIEQEVVHFKRSPALTPQLQKSLIAAISEFQEYFQKVGFESNGPVDVYLASKGEVNAHYYLDRNLIVIHKSLAHDRDVAVREYARYAIESVAKINFFPLVSALADYFTCSFKGISTFGENSIQAFRAAYGNRREFQNPYIRNLRNDKTFIRDTVYEAHDAGEIIGAGFWDVHELIGQDQADRLLFSSWRSLKPKKYPRDEENVQYRDGLPFRDFVEKLVELIQASPAGDKATAVRDIFKKRGISV